MYYFDSDYLRQYLNIGKDVVVTVDGEVLTLSDESDVDDSNEGVAFDANGSPSSFQYTDIEQIQVGQNIITLELLQKIMNGTEVTPEPEKKTAKPSEEEPPAPEDEEPAPDEEPPAKGVEKSSFDIYLLGRELINESRRKKR